MNNWIAVTDNRNMTTIGGLWMIRSKDNEVLALFESDTFKTIYEYCQETWPALLQADMMTAMRIR